jgi:hypothetical protein
VAPANYTGPGTVWSNTSYTTSADLTEQGIISITYYFWVTGITSVAVAAKKTLSIAIIAQYI